MAKTDSLTVKLGRKLKSLRQEKGFSQESFADTAQIDRSGYGRIERGEADIRLSTIERIAKALKLPIAALFEGLK